MIKTVGIKAGTFSIVSGGHVSCLHECKNRCDYLVCITQPDYIIKQLKGFLPPIRLPDRIIILDSIRYVDEVGVYDDKTEEKWLQEFKDTRMERDFPNAKLVMFHSEELKGRDIIPGKGIVDDIIYVPRRYISTSTMIERLLKERANG